MYYLDDGNDYELYAIKVNGGGRHQITDNDFDDEEPSWSPNGKRIAYDAYDGNDTEIYTISTTGGTRRQVTDNDTYDYDVDWGVGP